jgi:hypothetical protein
MAFSIPVFYLFFRLNKPEIFSWGKLATKILAALIWSIIVWFFYGIFCLIAPPLGEEPAEDKIEPEMADLLATHDIFRGTCKKCKCTEYYIRTNKYRCPK